MRVNRLAGIPGFSIDRVAAATNDAPDVLRLENLDTDLGPPAAAIAATLSTVATNQANSYLPFNGQLKLREAVTQRLTRQTGTEYDPDDIVITCGGTEGMLDALLATTDPGDEVILTDPTYAGMINRVRLIGAVPRFVPFAPNKTEWRLDLDALQSVVSSRTRALFIMNPSMPSGAVLNAGEWDAIAEVCRERDLWLIYNAAMECILFDGCAYVHPATLEGMAERTITIGSVSKEYRMIGWRIGWVAGPRLIMKDLARVHIYNCVTPPGIAQAGACAALQTSNEDFGLCLTEWQMRRDVMLEELRGFPVIRPMGGWSMLLDVAAMGYDSFTASALLLDRGKVAATPMRDWGESNSDQFVRFVFSKEPAERLSGLCARVGQALDGRI